MNDLVERLSVGEHPVEVMLRPDRSVAALKRCIDRGYVHVRFTGTRGGTELGVPVDASLSDWTQADFEHGTGRIRLVGLLNLDFVDVKCVADIDVAALAGVGHLERLA